MGCEGGSYFCASPKVTDLPMHGKGKELGSGLVHAIKKQLGLK
jgi:hypothetical protein